MNSIKPLALVMCTMLCVLACCPSSARASITLQIGLGTIVQSTNQVTIPIEISFTATDTDLLPDQLTSFIFDISSSSSQLISPLSPSITDYSRFSITNLRTNWEFNGIDSGTGVFGISPNATLQNAIANEQAIGGSIVSGTTAKLADVVIDTTGLAATLHTVQFTEASTVVLAQINGNTALTHNGGELNFANPGSRSFNITAVPEPTSIVTAALLATGLAWRFRGSSKRRNPRV